MSFFYQPYCNLDVLAVAWKSAYIDPPKGLDLMEGRRRRRRNLTPPQRRYY